MKDSGIEWIGEIPEEWDLKKAKFLFEQRNTRGNDKNLELLSPTQRYGVIPQSKYEELTSMRAVKLNEQVDLINLKTIHAGDYCISLRSFQGGFEYSQYEGVVSPAYQVFYARELISNNYYKYLFKDSCFINRINSFTLSLRDGKSISYMDFGRIELPYPPLSEQTTIANYLDKKCSDIDSLANDIQKQIGILEQYRKSVITETVTKGLDPNVKMKDSGIEWISEVPEEWKIKRIKYMFNVVSGSTPKSDNFDYWDGDVIWITPADYKTLDKHIGNSSRNISKLGLQSCSTTLVPKESIIFSKRAPIGTVAIAAVNLCTNQGCLSCIPKQEVYSLFYYYVMSIATEDFELKGSGTTFKEISTTAFNDSQLPFPPFSVQQQIASYLDSKCSKLDELMRLKNQQLETLMQYKKSLIYEYVTGKREVN